MMDQHNSKGWLNRRKLANLNRFENADEERLAIRRERQKLYDAQAAVDEAARVAYEAANAAAECRCPGCGGAGRLPVPQAMRIVKGLHLVGFHDHSVTAKEIATLAAIANGQPIPPGCAPISFSYGAISPAPGHVPPAVETVPAEVTPPKPTKGRKPPVEDTATTFLLDGALVED